MTTETVTKPVWTRCKGSGTGESNGCGQRVYNSPIDIERHRQHCPADLERAVKLLTDRVEKLEKAEPEHLDLDGVADWPDADSEDAFDDTAERPPLTAVAGYDDTAAAPVPAAAHVNASTYFADDDPDDDL